MKESYKELELEVIRFEVEDIITSSCSVLTQDVCLWGDEG